MICVSTASSPTATVQAAPVEAEPARKGRSRRREPWGPLGSSDRPESGVITRIESILRPSTMRRSNAGPGGRRRAAGR
jgi:hypothetical protein